MESYIYTPTVTIFDNKGNIDIEGNKKLIEYLIKNGVDGLVPLGSTGEFPFISINEQKKLIKLYVDIVKNRVDLIVGTNSPNIEETIELANYALNLGVKGVLILPPSYYELSQEEGYKYYSKIATKITGNIYIYNFYARTGFDINEETLLKLVTNFSNIKGIKDSTTSIEHTKRIINTILPIKKDFEVYSGFDNHFIPNVISGGKGCIAAISNFEPLIWKKWVEAMKEENFFKLVEISKVIDKLMELYKIQSNFSLLFKNLIDEIEINTYTKFPFNEIPESLLENAKNIRKEAKEIFGRLK